MSRLSKITPFAVLPIIFIIAFIVVMQIGNISKEQPKTTSSETIPIQNKLPAQISSSNNNATAMFKDGEYSATVDYEVPEENINSLSVNVTIANDTISAISYKNNPTEKTSQRYGSRFDSDFSETKLISEPVDKAQLSRLGGASLTSNAFNEALKKAVAPARI